MGAAAAQTAAEAQDEFRKLLVEQSENRLRQIGQCPRFAEYLEQTYLPRLAAFGKKPDTLVKETGRLGGWCERIGHLHLDEVRPHYITAHLQKLKESGKANRTCNLALAMLRNVLKSARVDGFIKTLPVEGIQSLGSSLRSARNLQLLCELAGFGPPIKLLPGRPSCAGFNPVRRTTEVQRWPQRFPLRHPGSPTMTAVVFWQ